LGWARRASPVGHGSRPLCRTSSALDRRSGTGGSALRIGDEAGRKLEAAKENASITLHTGEDDGFLRRLVLHASFPLKRTRDLGGSVGRLRGAEVRFSLSLRRPNRPLRVRRPPNLQPLSALGARRSAAVRSVMR